MKKTPAQKARHLKHAAQYIKLQRKAKKAWNDLVEREHMRVFGRPFEITDYKISGIARDEYAQPVKTRLRALAHKSTRYGDQAVKHWKAAGKRMHISRLKDSIKTNPAQRDDKHAQRELLLFIINDGALYRQQGAPIIANLQKKFRKGVFDQAKAVKLYRYLADNGAKKYTYDYDDKRGATSWNRVPGYGIFSVADRNAVAAELLAYYLEEITAQKNPIRRRAGSKRIHRPNIRLTAYVTRPSQITRKKPSKRLVKRRREVQVRPAKGFFPNPSALLIQKHTGKNWITLLRMPDTPANRKKANYAARSLARKTGLSATVRVIRT